MGGSIGVCHYLAHEKDLLRARGTVSYNGLARDLDCQHSILHSISLADCSPEVQPAAQSVVGAFQRVGNKQADD